MDTMHRIFSLLQFATAHHTAVKCRVLLRAACMLPVASLLIGLASCRPDTVCRQDIDVVAGITTEWVLTDTAGNATQQAAWDSVSVWGIGNDSLLYDNRYAVETLALPLRTDSALSTFVILWHDAYDTLYIHHDNTRKFISSACGCAVYHTIDSTWVAGTFVDSLYIVNSSVETVQQTNIHLLLR